MTWTTFDSNGKQQIAGSIADMPVGTIVDFAADNPPNGWLKCDGSIVSRIGFSDLFAVISTNYGSGDGSTTFGLPDISGSIIFATPLDKRIKVLTPPQYVTALPAAPIDGQEIYYRADSTNGIIWHLRYNAASSSSYKWEFVGGSPIEKTYTAGFETLSASTGWVDAPTVGPKYDIVLAGDYMVQAQVSAYKASSGVIFAVGIAKGQNTPVFSLSTDTYAANIYDAVTTCGIVTGATTDIRMRYYQNVGSTIISTERRMLVTPVRVG